ncbi:unnamed protein product [Thelazia callipaeda]|uniref:PH domain-containing protein n=1 Tax=Thelazia callipaeda TaxID=103827 RepID=A0A0N5CSW0_THECL|nr:unnamed protein product [Thelazia callipaeda]
MTFHKWMVALRIAKNGRHLFENYLEMRKQQNHTESTPIIQPVKIGIPQVSSPATFIPESNRESVTDVRSHSVSHPHRQQDLQPLLNMNGNVRSLASSKNSLGINNDDSSSPRQNSIIFDQCDDSMTGTIKRAPCDLMMTNRRQSAVTNHRSPSDGIASPSGRSGGTNDSDSDEEQFPPPPSILVATGSDQTGDLYASENRTPTGTPIPRTTFVQHEHLRESNSNQQGQNANYNDSIASVASSNGNYALGMKAVLAPVPPSKPQLIMQNLRNHSNDNGLAFVYHNSCQAGRVTTQAPLLLKKAPPPPPPKRSDTTKLQSTNVEALHSELEIAMARRLHKISQI